MSAAGFGGIEDGSDLHPVKAIARTATAAIASV
jgi:hypothetical protein